MPNTPIDPADLPFEPELRWQDFVEPASAPSTQPVGGTGVPHDPDESAGKRAARAVARSLV
jgi:hypothetical protein